MRIAYVLFDMDESLYPAGIGLMREINAHMTRYIAEHLGMSYGAADAMRRQYHEIYGSSTRGLLIHHPFTLNLSDYVAFVYDIPIDDYLSPNADLACLLDCIQAKKAIFTNAPAEFAERVLDVLNVRRQFTRIFDIKFSRYFGKPIPLAYVRVQQALHAPADRLLLVDHHAENLAPARFLQWHTVWFRGNPSLTNGKADYSVDDLWQAVQAFYDLGVMDEKHRELAEHRLMDCEWTKRKELVY